MVKNYGQNTVYYIAFRVVFKTMPYIYNRLFAKITT